MWTFFLGCVAVPESGAPGGDDRDTAVDSDTADTGADDDTALDTTTEPGLSSGPLDACVDANVDLVEVWSAPLRAEGALPERFEWRDDVLVAIAGLDEIVVADLPIGDAVPGVTDTLDYYENWHDLVMLEQHGLAGAGGWSLGLWNVATGSGGQVWWRQTAGGLRSVAESPAGVRVAGPDFVGEMSFQWMTSAEVEQPFEVVTRVGGDSGGSWLVGTIDGTYGVSLDRGDGYGEPVMVPGPCTEPSGILPLGDGGAVVGGGMDAYAWYARFDRDGVLLSSSIFESPAMPAIDASPASENLWGVFDYVGLYAIGLGGGYSGTMGAMDGLVDLVVDPGGAWILTLGSDGIFRRWTCPSEE